MFSHVCLWLASIWFWEENLERSNFIMSVKGIVLYVRLKVRFIEEGAFICDFLGVCDKGFNVFALALSSLLLQRTFTFLTPTPPSNLSHSSKKEWTIWTQQIPKTSRKSLYNELISSLTRFYYFHNFVVFLVRSFNCELGSSTFCWVFWWFYMFSIWK